MMAVLLLCPLCAESMGGNDSLMLLALLAVPFIICAAVFFALRRLDA
jgi:hypothetical protein